MTDEERQVVVDGLVETAVTLAERHERDDTALRHLRDLAEQVGSSSADVFREAADAITRLPLPPLESAEETARLLPLRRMRGEQTVEERLAAALAGREWLTRLAEEMEGG